MADDEAILPLFIWLSPAFPVGSFAYSHGCESVIEAGDIKSNDDLRHWLEASLRFGSARTDALLLAQAWHAQHQSKVDVVHELNELALALAPSSERYLETSAQGYAFVRALKESWPCPPLMDFAETHETIAYPIALAIASAHYKCPIDMSLNMFLIAFINNIVSACVRLGPIGQTEAQKILAWAVPLIKIQSAEIITLSIEDLGSSTLRFDLASLQHETLYSRLFRS
jgi:urease accessory protein